MVKKKLKCFWCEKSFEDLVKHTKEAHPGLSPRSYDLIPIKKKNTKEYILKRCNPPVTIQEASKEDFKKMMNWDEEEFMKHVFMKTK